MVYNFIILGLKTTQIAMLLLHFKFVDIEKLSSKNVSEFRERPLYNGQRVLNNTIQCDGDPDDCQLYAFVFEITQSFDKIQIVIIERENILGESMTKIEKQLQDELIGLQISFVEQERRIEQLSSIILKMQKDMTGLHKELSLVKERVESPGEGEEFNMAEERPPHY